MEISTSLTREPGRFWKYAAYPIKVDIEKVMGYPRVGDVVTIRDFSWSLVHIPNYCPKYPLIEYGVKIRQLYDMVSMYGFDGSNSPIDFYDHEWVVEEIGAYPAYCCPSIYGNDRKKSNDVKLRHRKNPAIYAYSCLRLLTLIERKDETMNTVTINVSQPKFVSFADMPIGSFGIIRETDLQRYVGTLVKRVNKDIVASVVVSNQYWEGASQQRNIKVELLPRGSSFTVTIGE